MISFVSGGLRSVQMMSPDPDMAMRTRSIPRPMSLAGPTSTISDVIDKASFFASASAPVAKAAQTEDQRCNWEPTQLRPVPAFYPLERSSRFVEDELSVVAARLSEANRVLSVHAVYNNENATASLLTAENVEMHLSLWKTGGGPKMHPEGIVVELQRRKGDSIPFHRYSRYLLDAAVGDFDSKEHVDNGGEIDVVYSKKVQRMLNLEAARQTATEQENAIIAIEIAHGLLMKDRMDARQLGLESLCLLTDPKKTGVTTAIIASRVVLLGTAQGLETEQDDNLLFDEAPFQEIRESILSLIQLKRIGNSDDFDDEVHSEEEEHNKVLHNLALAVLANALDVIENEESLLENDERNPEFTRKRSSTSGSVTSICESFLNDACEMHDDEILKTLIRELGSADQKPHDACLSAKCIGSLCRASEEARKRAKELGAKTVVQTALDVGTRTHLRLETECEKLTKVLQRTEDN